MAARHAGIAERSAYTFRPHMPLGYRTGAPFSQRVVPVDWTADRVVLVHSHLERTRHEVFDEWALDGGAQLSLF